MVISLDDLARHGCLLMARSGNCANRAEHDHSRSNQPDAATPRGVALAAEERHAPSDCGRERQRSFDLCLDSEERIASVLPFETSAYLEGTA